MRLTTLIITWAATAIPSSPRAQTPAESTIRTTATAEVRRPPSYAVIQVGIRAAASTAAEAMAQVAASQQALLVQLNALGFPADSLPTTRYSVAREATWETDSVPGFAAQTSMRVVVTDLGRVGTIVDAAVNAGANDIPTIEFKIDDPRSARDEALRAAVAEARHEAEVMAEAAGGRLGELLEITTGRLGAGLMRSEGVVVSHFTVDQRVPVAVTPDDVVTTATVSLRWRFIPSEN